LQEVFEPAPEAEQLVSVAEPAPGTRIRYFGDYELLEEPGHGGMGVVYKARQVSLNRLVAVKLIQGGEFAGRQFVQRFRTEAEAAARLQHPNIVAIHEVGEYNGQHYFSMDYVEGLTLEEEACKGPLAPQRAAALVRTIAEAIHYAHGQGILHRDLKPSNVLLDRSGQPRILDFGLAKVLTGNSELTLSGQPLGSPGYMAPEQAAGRRSHAGPQSDVYALGAVLYYLLTGRAPFHAETLTDVLRQVRESEPVRPRVLTPSVPRDLETISLKCLEKQSHRRYQSARELAEELGRFGEGKPILARPVSRPERLWRWCRRQPIRASLIIALILTTTVGLTVVVWQWQHAVKARRYAERLVYAADMNLAFQAIRLNNLQEALHHLSNHWPKGDEPDLRGWEWRYLWRLCRSDELLTLGVHEGGAGAVAFSPDGRLLASGGTDGQVKIWDLSLNRQVHHLGGGNVSVFSLAFSPDGSQLAVGGWGGMMLWNARTWRKEDAVRIIDQGRVDSLRFSPDGRRLVAANDSGLGIWHRETGRGELAPIRSVPVGSVGQHSCALSADGQIVAHATITNGPFSAKVILRNLETGATRTIWESKTHNARTLAWSPDGKWLVLARNVGVLEVCDTSNLGETPEATPEARTLDTEYVFALAFSPDGKILAAGCINGRIELYDTATWRKRDTLTGHHSWIMDIAFSPDPNASLLATASDDGTVRLWSTAPKPREDLVPLPAHPEGWDPNWETVIYLDRKEGTYRLYDYKEQALRPRQPLPYAATNVVTATVAPRAEALAFALEDGSVRLWDRTGQRQELWSVPARAGVGRLHFSSDGRLLFGMGERGSMMWVWDVGKGREVASAKNSWNMGFWYLPQFTTNQQQLAIPFGLQGDVCLWDFAGSGRILRFKGRHPGCNNVALSPDGRTLATVNRAGTIKLWNVESRTATATIEGSGLPLMSVIFSPDGERLITGGPGEIKIWDVNTRREVGDLGGDPVEAWNVFFRNPDTLLLATTKGIRILHAPSLAKIEAEERNRKQWAGSSGQ